MRKRRGRSIGHRRCVFRRLPEEDEPQDVVLDVVDLAVEVGHLLLLSPAGVFELRDLAAKAVGAPEAVDAAPLRDGHQPRDRVLRDAGGGPLLERGH
ncbi:MAG: hypothetical protein ACXVEU_15030, partial [Nocardioidaceae bacterium]